jgi:diaminopimelate epimerase
VRRSLRTAGRLTEHTAARWQALGNVYVITDETELTAERARELARGADGVVEVLGRGDDSVDVRIWNPDGTVAEMSGNATRIAARWLARETGADEVTVRVGPRTVPARMLGGDDVEQDLGEFAVGEDEEVDGVRFTPVDVGNPHAVVLGDPDDLPSVGPRLETHPRFPDRTNVQIARVDGPGLVTARVWERGVGETAASGTSAVAVAAATHAEGDVTVRFPGGELLVRLAAGRALLVGPAAPLRVPRQVLVYVHRAGPEFLLLERIPENGGFWQGVSGAPVWGESDDDAARRELREETGLDAKPRPIGFRYEIGPAEGGRWQALYGPGIEALPEEVYEVEAPHDWEPTIDHREHTAYRWCLLDEALALLSWEDNKRGLEAVARSLPA